MNDREVKVNQLGSRKVEELAQKCRGVLQISLTPRCLDIQEGKEAECQAVPSTEQVLGLVPFHPHVIPSARRLRVLVSSLARWG